MATWTKLKTGDWGITIDGTAKVGQTLQVKSKAGEVKTVTVTKVVWTGNGKSICAIEDTPRQSTADYSRGVKTTYRRKSSTSDTGWKGNGCSACRAKGDWCDRCAFDEFDC